MNKEIDIIIPVYNGFEFLEPLFFALKNTSVKHNVIVIEDCSQDPRIRTYLKDLPNIVLLLNDRNIGFVKSVNRGFKASKNHIVLLNTDTELPCNWLERLIAPILTDKNIASATPFTNAGTICSFPNIGEDNELFSGMTVNEIDAVFSAVKPKYTEMPTGVGFCMAMNRDVINKIGFFDDTAFSKGYGEENDWCQRAIKSGFKNVICENLFVYHKHGGSFTSKEKQRLIDKNSRIITQRYPNYNADVADYFAKDSLKNLRNFIAMKALSLKRKNILVFDHNIGGGATKYIENIIRGNKAENFFVIRYCSSENCYIFAFDAYKYKFNSLREASSIAAFFNIKEVYVNELVTYPKLYEVLKIITGLNIKIKFFLHDYFCVCPSYTLLNDKRKYCAVPESGECENCFKNLNECNIFGGIKEYRRNWLAFFKQTDEIIAFSDSSKEIFEKAYGTGLNIYVIPHIVNYVTPVCKERHSGKTLNLTSK